MPRIHCPTDLSPGAELHLPAGAARHVQVLRLQPGHEITLFNGRGGQYRARILHMGRSDVRVQVGPHEALEREALRDVHLALGVPANDRMDDLVEKATELGVRSLQPLALSRNVVQLSGERAAKRLAHWQAIAAAACEQCGRNRLPLIQPICSLDAWLARRAPDDTGLLLLPGATQALAELPAARTAPSVSLLSGPEGGLSPDEAARAQAAGLLPIHLGARVLRADTAPLAALAWLTLTP